MFVTPHTFYSAFCLGDVSVQTNHVSSEGQRRFVKTDREAYRLTSR